MRQPLVVLVSGAPGAGKTTLATKLSALLRVPHVPRDEIMRGIEMTAGDAINKGTLGIETYFSLLKTMIDGNISFITDGTLYKDLSEQDVALRLTRYATVINVHVKANARRERFIEREKSREGWSDEWLQNHLDHLDAVYPRTIEPLNLGVPLIEVCTDSDYKPDLKTVARRIHEIYNDTRPGGKILWRIK